MVSSVVWSPNSICDLVAGHGENQTQAILIVFSSAVAFAVPKESDEKRIDNRIHETETEGKAQESVHSNT
ncbi:hypothetical protein M5689_005884 [Euphorbia peplus]|nr:hypothetical protein M5689_005884 [Euphorbia peplus]